MSLWHINYIWPDVPETVDELCSQDPFYESSFIKMSFFNPSRSTATANTLGSMPPCDSELDTFTLVSECTCTGARTWYDGKERSQRPLPPSDGYADGASADSPLTPKPTTKGPPNSNSEQVLPTIRATEVVGTTFTELEALSRVLDLSPFPFLCGWETRAVG